MRFKFFVVTLLVVGLIFGLSSLASATVTISFDDANSIGNTNVELATTGFVPIGTYILANDSTAAVVVHSIGLDFQAAALTAANNYAIWLDKDLNGIVSWGDVNVKTAALTPAVTNANLAVVLTTDVTVPATGSARLIITMDGVGATTTGDNVKFTFQTVAVATPDADFVSVPAGQAFATATGATAPNQANAAIATITYVTDTGTLTQAASTPVAAATVGNRSTNIPMISFALTAAGQAQVLNTLGLTTGANYLSGNGQTAITTFDSIRVWVDNGTVGTLDAADIRLGVTAVYDASPKAFPIASGLLIPVGTTNILVTASIAPVNADGDIIDLATSAATSVVSSADVITGADLDGNNMTVAALAITAKVTRDYANFPFKSERPNGYLDAVQLTFNHPVQDTIITSAVVRGDIDIFATAGAPPTIPFTSLNFVNTYQGDNPNDTNAIIRFSELVDDTSPLQGKTGDADVVLLYTSSASRILSADGNYALPDIAAGVGDAVADGAAPAPLSITTGDANSNGNLDRIFIQFSENLAGTGVAASQDSATVPPQKIAIAGYYDKNDAVPLIVGAAPWTNATSQLVIDLTEKKSDTGATPAVDFLGGAGVMKDAANNDVLAWIGNSQIPTIDGAAPIVTSLETKDADGDAKLDGIAVKVSEPVGLAAGKTVADLVKGTTLFAFAGGFQAVYTFADSGHTGVGTGTLTLLVNEQQNADTAVKPIVNWTVGAEGAELVDLSAGKLALASFAAPKTASDKISARLLAAISQDGAQPYFTFSNGKRNGKIDSYKLIFSEAMSGIDSLYNNVRINGVLVAKDSAVVINDTVWVKITGDEPKVQDTALLHQVTYDTTGIGKQHYMLDLNGGIFKSFGAADVVETDGAAPYVTATTKDTPMWVAAKGASETNGKIDAMVLTFSEAIDTTGVQGNGSDADVIANTINGLWEREGFGFGPAPAGYALMDTLATFGTDLKGMTLRIDEVAVDTGVLPDLTFTASATSKIKDAAGNVTPNIGTGDATGIPTADGITEQDGVPAVVVTNGAKTIDDNLDGYLDGVLLTFSENVNVTGADTTAVRSKVVISNIGATKIDLTNATITATGNTDVKLVGISTKDATAWNTAKTPKVAINAGNGIKDAAKNEARVYNRKTVGKSSDPGYVAPDSVSTKDNAAPILVQVSGQLNQKTIMIRFSEPVTDNGALAQGTLNVANFVYKSAVGPNTIKTVALTSTAVSDTSQWVVTVDSTLTMARLTADSLIINANTVKDQPKGIGPVVATNTNPGDTLAIFDAALPTLVKAETVDADSNGYLDNIRLYFSENINDANILGVPAVYKSLYFGYAPGIDTMWTVSGYDVLGINLTASKDSATAATGYLRSLRVLSMTDKPVVNVRDVRNDNIIYIAIKPAEALAANTGDTGVKPTISMKGGAKDAGGSGVGDYTPNYVANITNSSVSDGASPILLSAAMPSRVQMNIYVSEPFKSPLADAIVVGTDKFSDAFKWIVGTEGTDFSTAGQILTFSQDAKTKNLYTVTLLAPGLNYDTPSYLMYRASNVIQDANNVKNVLLVGSVNDSIIVTPPSITGVEVANVPAEFGLAKNFPNPFNPTTTINYDIADNGGMTTLVIYNMAGQKVRTLVNEVKVPGYYSATWNGLDDNGKIVSSGIYLYKLVCGSFNQIEKMTLVK